MGTVYARGGKLWLAYQGTDGNRRWKPTGFNLGEEAKARDLLARVERQVEAQKRIGATIGASVGEVTVANFAKAWLEKRVSLASYASEEARVRLYLLPDLGNLPIAEVRPRHLIGLIRDLRASGKLAVRSVHHVYGTAHVMFRDAVLEELIPVNPCVLTKHQLGKKEDKNPEWRSGALYTRDELEMLISSVNIPFDRQVIYAIAGLSGLRFGEIAGLRWRHYDPEAKPLGRLVVAHSHDRATTKTGRPREVPVHLVLASMLAEWKLGGWVTLMGRRASPDDLVVPSRKKVMRSMNQSLHRLHDDLETLGYRKRRFHDLRRTFITLARVDGARADLLEMITHAPRGNIINIYTSMPWPSLCEEVAKLKVERRMGQVMTLPMAAQVGEKSKPTVTVGVTVSRDPTAATIKVVRAAGFEPATSTV